MNPPSIASPHVINSPDVSMNESIKNMKQLESQSSFVSNTDTLSTKAATEDDSKQWSGSILSADASSGGGDATTTSTTKSGSLEHGGKQQGITVAGDSHHTVRSPSPLAFETAALVKGVVSNDDEQQQQQQQQQQQDLKPSSPRRRISKRLLAEMIADVMISTMEGGTDCDSQSTASNNHQQQPQRSPSNQSISIGSSWQSTWSVGDSTADSTKFVKLPPGIPGFRREKATEVVCATPPSKPKRQLSDDDLSQLRAEFKVSQANRRPPRRTKNQESTSQERTDSEDDLDISSHSAPPSVMGQSNSSWSTKQNEISSEDKTEISPKSQPPVRFGSLRRAASEKSLTRDLKPLRPSRRSCSDESSNLVPVDENAAGTDTAIMRAEDMEAYVLARLPDKVKRKLPAEAWSRIFSVVAETHASNSSGSASTPLVIKKAIYPIDHSDSTAPGSSVTTTELVCADDGASVVSGLTCPSELCSIASEQSSAGDSGVSSHNSPGASSSTKRNSTSAVLASSTLPSSLAMTPPTRTWTSSNGGGAPRLPRHRRPYPSATTASLPDLDQDETMYLGGQPKCKSESFLLIPSITNSKKKKTVTFGKLHIQHYERILEINPCTSSGPAVGLGWRHSEVESIDIDDVEEASRGANAFLLPRHVRERIVKDLGYSKRDVAYAIRQSLRIKNQRKQTYNNLSAQKVEYLVEKSRRKVSRLLKFRSRKSMIQRYQ